MKIAKITNINNNRRKTTNEKQEPIIRTAANFMIEAMRDLKEKKITPKEAQGMALLGKCVIDAANIEIQFIKTVKGLSRGGIFDDNIQYLEPNIDDDTTLEFKRVNKK
jgi:hypothetical protein